MIALLVEIDVEVDPFALGGELELFIAPDVLIVEADEGFGDVPVPQLVRLGRRIGGGFKVELLVRRGEEEIEAVISPTGANLGAMRRNRIPKGVARDEDRFGLCPET